MKILILNRRDINNPAGGGAEVYTHEIAKGLINDYACEVTIFTSRFAGASREEVIDGVYYIRAGNELTVHMKGFYFAVKNRKKFDRIVDEYNGLGFMTFLLPNSVLLIHQLYREFWLRELGFIGALPYLLEPMIIWLYRKRNTITISDSTKKDLEGLGFRDISIVMIAINEAAAGPAPLKDREPTMVFLGRFKSTKRPEDAIEVFKVVRRRIPDARLRMIGRGPEEEKLKDMASGLDGVMFQGYVSEDEKMALLRRSHVLFVPSVREGFGINVIEAAAAGMPAVGYDVHGIRDAILDNKTGYLVHSVDEAALKIVALLSPQRLYERMSSACIEHSREFVWSRRVSEFWKIISR